MTGPASEAALGGLFDNHDLADEPIILRGTARFLVSFRTVSMPGGI